METIGASTYRPVGSYGKVFGYICFDVRPIPKFLWSDCFVMTNPLSVPVSDIRDAAAFPL